MHPSAIPPELLAALVVAAVLIGLIQSVRLAVLRWLPGRRLRLARERGAQGEVRAEALLRRLGYAIVARQAARSYGVSVDGQPFNVALRADFLVERDHLCYVAEVKTGRLAPRLDTPATRRQLLEYRVAFQTAGVLLVDVDAGRVHSVEFPLPMGQAADRHWLGWMGMGWLVIGVAVGIGASIMAGRWSLPQLAPPATSGRR